MDKTERMGEMNLDLFSTEEEDRAEEQAGREQFDRWYRRLSREDREAVDAAGRSTASAREGLILAALAHADARAQFHTLVRRADDYRDAVAAEEALMARLGMVTT